MVGISPEGVYSQNLNVDYFGFSKGINAFSTYFNTNKNHTIGEPDSSMEFIYQANNLIHSFSDFRDDASYENIEYNFNSFKWSFRNSNQNQKNLIVKIILFFDLSDNFITEQFISSIPMNRTLIKTTDFRNASKSIVKLSNQNEINLKFNETVDFLIKFPLYFENCKNYKLNFVIVMTGFLFLLFLVFVIFYTIILTLEHGKEEDLKES